jgi:hypothetical protein
LHYEREVAFSARSTHRPKPEQNIAMGGMRTLLHPISAPRNLRIPVKAIPGAKILQTVRKVGDNLSAARISRPITAQSEKNPRKTALRDFTEPRTEFSHGLLDFCTKLSSIRAGRE